MLSVRSRISSGARWRTSCRCVGPGESSDGQATAGVVVGQQGREQGRIRGPTGFVGLFLDGDDEVLFVGGGAQRIRPRLFALPLLVLEVGDEVLEDLKLVGIDGDKMARLVVHGLARGEKQGGAVLRLHAHLRHRHLEIPDPAFRFSLLPPAGAAACRPRIASRAVLRHRLRPQVFALLADDGCVAGLHVAACSCVDTQKSR